jgi:acyl carrier protein
MNKEEIIAKMIPIVSTYAQNQDALAHLTEETDFISDLKINSANLVDVILDIEESFNIEIDNESMEKMLTVKAAIEVIENKLNLK